MTRHGSDDSSGGALGGDAGQPGGGSSGLSAGAPATGGSVGIGAAGGATGGTGPSGGNAGTGGQGAGPGTGGTPSGGAPNTGGSEGSTSGGTRPSGGAAGTGGGQGAATPDTGGAMPRAGAAGSGQGALGGAADAGGAAGTAGDPVVPVTVECDEAADCELAFTPCGCAAVPLGAEAPSDPAPCEEANWCTVLGVDEEQVECLRGRCTLARDCDYRNARCNTVAPECPSGQVASVLEACWGPCVAEEECMLVPDLYDGSDVFAGVWLIGWEGGALHYSALRFPPETDTSMAGEMEFLSEPDVEFNSPYFLCSGVGSWMANSLMASFSVFYPPDCASETERISLTYTRFEEADGRFGSTLRAVVEIRDGEMTDTVDAFWFPSEACNAEMSACTFGAR